MGNPRYSNGSRRRALLARMRSVGGPCWICGLPIDYGLPAGDPLSFECDELVPVSKGGSPYDPANCAHAHRCCNQWRGAKPVQEVEAVRSAVRSAFGPPPSPLAFCEAARAVMKGGKGAKASVPVRHPKRASGVL